MIFWLVESIRSLFPKLTAIRVFEYVTFRTGMALMLAFVVSLIFGPAMIAVLRRKTSGARILKFRSDNGPDLSEMHAAKEGTPIMGGLLMLVAILLSTLVFCRLSSVHVWTVIIASLALAGIGFFDDYVKITQRNPRGIPARVKLIGQTLVGLGVGIFIYSAGEGLGISYDRPWLNNGPVLESTHLCFPFVKTLYPNLGIGIILFAVVVMVSTSNAVNLTDGLDGLAAGVSTVVAGTFLIVAYLVSNVKFARYLMFPYIAGGEELVVILGAMVGAGFGFLWFNAHPAEVFMGDTGSLLLGGILGTIALLIKQEFLLVIVGGIFVLEALSVIAQVGSFKTRGKRVLLMAPLHHHYQRLGLEESKIIARFWIVTFLLALAGLATLKLR